MTFTISQIAASLAAYLAPVLTGVTFYEDPNQQGTSTPCAFLQQRYAKTRRETSERWIRTIGLDLTYLEDYNLPDLQRRYQAAAEALDIALDRFPYSDGVESAQLLTYDRDWRIDLDALHYKFEIRVRVSLPEDAVKMQVIEELNEEVIADEP